MELYRKRVMKNGAGSQSMTVGYVELTPTELANLGKTLNLAAMEVVEKLKEWAKEGERIVTDQTRSCFVGVQVRLDDLKEEHLSPANLSELEKMRKQSLAFKAIAQYEDDSIRLTWLEALDLAEEQLKKGRKDEAD